MQYLLCDYFVILRIHPLLSLVWILAVQLSVTLHTQRRQRISAGFVLFLLLVLEVSFCATRSKASGKPRKIKERDTLVNLWRN